MDESLPNGKEDIVTLYDGRTSLLPDHLRQSATRRWPQIEVWYITNAIVMTVCLLIFAYFYFRG